MRRKMALELGANVLSIWLTRSLTTRIVTLVTQLMRTGWDSRLVMNDSCSRSVSKLMMLIVIVRVVVVAVEAALFVVITGMTIVVATIVMSDLGLKSNYWEAFSNVHKGNVTRVFYRLIIGDSPVTTVQVTIRGIKHVAMATLVTRPRCLNGCNWLFSLGNYSCKVGSAIA